MTKGRKPLAHEIKVARGSYNLHPGRENKLAPIADGQAPEMPDWFNDFERQKWNDLVGDLTTNGVLSSDVREILIAYCTAYAHWMECRAKVLELGLAIESIDKSGGQVIGRNQFAIEMRKYREQMNRLLPELGLTPASRQKLARLPDEDKTESAFENIMARMRLG